MYQDHRVVSSSEAIFRICEYRIVEQSPPVSVINVQLPGEHLLYYNHNTTTAAEAQERYHSDVDLWFARPGKYVEVRPPHEYTDACPIRYI